jgi:hypothetical protein
MEYDEEEQRYQTSAAILMCTFCSCRLCSLFDTIVRVDDFEDDGPSETRGGAATTNSQDDGKSDSEDTRPDSDYLCLEGCLEILPYAYCWYRSHEAFSCSLCSGVDWDHGHLQLPRVAGEKAQGQRWLLRLRADTLFHWTSLRIRCPCEHKWSV